LINVVLVVLGVVLFRRGGKGRLAALAIAWFYISLAPVSNIIPIPGNMAGERFIYFTFAGMFPLLAAILPEPLPGRSAKPAAVAGLALLCTFVVMDTKRTAVWHDNMRYFSVLAEQVPDEPLVQSLMAKEEVLAGQPESAVRRLASIIGRTSTSRPEEKAALLYWYGRALLAAGWPQEAYRQFATVILLWRSVPGDLVPFLVEAAARSGRLGEARHVVEQALLRQPKDDVLWNSLGIVRGMEGDVTGARVAFERAASLNPGNREAATNLARARQMEGASRR
jgi:tetratricopeptide (TPR) repeat protein